MIVSLAQCLSVERAEAQTCSVITPIGSGNEEGFAAAVQADGRIVVAGYSDVGAGNLDFAVVRYFSTFALDTSFDTDGKVTTPIAGNDQGLAVAIQSDGKIVVAGFTDLGGGNFDFAVVRYNVNGSLDTTFDTDGKVTTTIGPDDQARTLAIQPDGKIVVGGWSNTGGSYKFAVVRYDTNGSLDPSFGVGGIATTPLGGINDKGFSIALQSDGKIVLAGESNNGANFDFGVVRYNTDGSLDFSFDTDGRVTTGVGVSGDFGRAVLIQSDGKIVVAGSVQVGANLDFGVVRYNTSGSLDFSFDTDGKVTTPVGASNDFPFDAGFQPDGKILVTGFSDVGAGNDNFAVVRYNTNGSPDTTFDTDGKVTTPVGAGDDFGYTFVLQPDGKIIVAGASHNGSNFDFSALRYNANGSVDMTCTSGPVCQPLLTTEGAGTLTVTAPSSCEMTFDTAFGGGLHVFYDLAEDPGRLFDLAGGPDFTGVKILHHSGIFSAGNFHAPGDNTSDTLSPRWIGSPPKLALLEATPTRVRVRQEAFFQQLGGTGVLPLKGFGDYSIYPSGRLALRWNRQATNTVAFTDQDLALGAISECGLSVCGNLTAYSFTGAVPFPEPAGNPGTDAFILAQREIPGRRTDFLSILYQNWGLANRVGYDQTVAFLTWRDTPVTTSPLVAGASDTWNFLTYFKPTNFASNADPQVTGRSTDYRGPDTLSVTLPATGWLDADENTSGTDFFNESEGAYVLNLDPATGLTFDINGAATTRYHPFFKIRQWRSLGAPSTVTLEGVPQTRDINYRSDVKPVSRAHFVQDLLWYSTFGGPSAVTSPNVGSAGVVNGIGIFVSPGKYGAQAALFDAAGENVTFPSAGNFDFNQGAVEFWYQPRYAHTDGIPHVLWHNFGNATHFFQLEKNAGNSLVFTVQNAAEVITVTVTSANYSWRNRDWVHLRATWDVAAAPGLQLRLFVNGVEAIHGDAGTYTAAGMVVGTNTIGSNSAGANTALGLIDEFHMFGVPSMPLLAQGGLATNASEYLASGTRNVTLSLQAVDALRRGDYLYFGADSKFRGLNIALQVPGAGVTLGALIWEYWEGSLTVGWGDLEALAGFNDQTRSLTKNGTVYWTGDPTLWSPYSLGGGPDLYYVRVRLATGETYSPFPVEAMVKTDILLFQHCGDISAALPQTFTFVAPVPTAVELLSFEAKGLDGAVDLSWQTATELDNLGFHLYRAESEDGPYTRITSSVIPGLGSSPVGASYRYRDPGLVNGRTYFYELEDIETTGKTERHGPASATPQAGTGGNDGSDGEPGGGPGGSSDDGPGDGGSDPGASRISYGDPSGASLRILERDSSHLVLELLTPGFVALLQGDGTVRLEIPGFQETASPGAPDLPVREALVEALAGRKVRLASITPHDLVSFDSFRIAAASSPEVEVSEEGMVKAASSPRRLLESHRRGGFAPRLWARLLETLFQGETKKARLQLAPLRHDPASGRTVLARRLTVRLEFFGTEPSERSLGGSRGRQAKPGPVRASGVLAQLVVKDPGLYRLRFEDVFGTSRRGVNARSLRLSRQGQPVAYHLEPDKALFAPGSSLFFLSEGDSLNPTGDVVYELGLGQIALRMGVVSGAPSGPSTTEYQKTLRLEQNRLYQAALLEAPDLWLWDLVVSPATKSYPFTVEALSSSATASQLKVALQGASDFPEMDHHLRLSVNGTPVAETTWDGKTEQVVEAEITPGLLVEGTNTLSLHNVGDAGASSSMVFLNRFEVSYPHRLETSNGSVEGRFASGRSEIAGLAAPGFVVDKTEAPVWLRSLESIPSGLAFRTEEGRHYLAVSQASISSPEVRRVTPTSLRSSANRARWILVGPREFLPAAKPLRELRRSQGLLPKTIALEDVFSEFGHGESDPQAMRDFLAYAFHNWRTPPRYVVLLGDSTYDPKDYLHTGVKDRVPSPLIKTSFLVTASDPTLAAVNGEDSLPDLAIGRLSAGSVEQAEKLVQKLVAFEQAGRSFTGTAVLVADNADLAGSFENDQDQIASGVLQGREVSKLYLRDLGASGLRAEIRSAFDSGPALMSYVGHGSTVVWASENVFNNLDVSSLQPQAQQPLLLTLNCLNGFFHFPPLDSLAEAFVKAEGKGAIAAFSPSGLSVNDAAQLYHKAFLGELENPTHLRLGDVLLAAQKAYADDGAFPELLSIYHLFGDPAMRIR